MAHGRFRFLPILCLLLALTAVGAPAYAQGGATSSIAGTVVDSSGGVVPGADVTAKSITTGTVFTAVSGANGAFSIPAIPSGTYTVTVALMGFKTAVLNGVIANVGVPATVKATLELGELSETVVVEAASQIVQTQATSVSSTLSVKQVSNLPLPGRGAFDFVSFMPGVATGGGGTRNATVNGLPQAMVNITLDGMNIQDNYAKSWDGMFTRVSPRLDAVEEITVGSASQDAGSASQGGVQIRFVTRSGTNRYQGSLYYYLQKDALNSNTWFNTHFNVDANGKPTAKPVVANYQPGGRIGGPIVIPGLFDGHDKAFFFVNYEWLSSPGTQTRTPTVMSPDSERGVFKYGANSVDLLALAARNGQVAAVDPLVAKTLASMRSSMSQGTLNATTDPATQTLSWQLPTQSKTTYPTVRIDYNLTKNNRLSGSYTRNHLVSDPDTTNGYYTDYPGFPVRGTQDSARYSGQTSLRTVLGSSMVNEFRFGATGGATLFFPSLSADMFSEFGGYGLIMNSFKSIANPYGTVSANSSREATTKVFEDTLNWVKGKHNISIGGNFTLAEVWLKNQQIVPTATMAMTASGDPADAMFNVSNFPGASSTDLTAAKALYSILTGRVSSIGRNARIAEDGTTYNILGESMQKGRLKQTGFHIQDSWRIKPNFTVNAGLRYELQLPFYAMNDSYSMAGIEDLFGKSGTGSNFDPGSTVSGIGNMYTPGATGGQPTSYELYSADTAAYHTDKNNLAPSLGAAWTTGSEKGFLHTLLGNPGDSVFRGGWSMAYFRPGMNDFTEIYGANPGVSIDATRNQTNGNLGTVPVLLSSGNLGAPAINLTRTYPMAVPSASSSVYVFDPNLRVPSSSSFNMGWQRALNKNTSIEARFIHTSSKDQWTVGNLNHLNYNEVNIVENGFLNEFKLAQQNLVANIAAGKGSTFAYTGAAGTRPLPIFLSWLNGSTASSDSSKYSGTGWTNTTLVQSMYALNPNPINAAATLRTNATYKANASTAGVPANFFVVNPEVTNADLGTNGPPTRYNGGQFIFTRRFTKGFTGSANYSYGKGYTGYFYSFRKPVPELEQTYQTRGAGNAQGNIRHVATGQWVYELPFGQGKKYGSGAGGFLNRVIGNWSWTGLARIQSGRLVDFGNVRLVGMTAKDLVNSFQTRIATDPANQYRSVVYMLPQDIIDNTIKAFNVTATGYGTGGAPTGRYMQPANGGGCYEVSQTSNTRPDTGYGDCGSRTLVVEGPMVMRWDMSLVKEIPIAGRVGFRFELQVFNVFNRVNFTPTTPGSSPVVTGGFSAADNYTIRAAADQARTSQLAFRLTW